VRRTVIPWVAAFAIFALATVGGVALANATVFSAGSFVRIYLDAIARGDAESALQLPGVDDTEASTSLLHPDALTGLDRLQQTSDVDLGGGVHRVAYSWVSPGGSGTSEFLVERVGTRFGLFPEWGFAVSPTSTISLTVSHDSAFFVNALQADTEQDSDDSVEYALFVPGEYAFGHESSFLTAAPQLVVAVTPGSQLAATIDVEANDVFVEQVQEEVDEHLDECATQDVLFPTGCPFGQAIENRVVSTPVWSIVDYPEVQVEAGAEFDTWTVPPASGIAHLVVDVQSLFDGSVSTFDEDVPFEVDYLITFTGPSAITIEQVP
jgi:hypothetical protein